MSDNYYQEKLKSIRYKYVDRKKERKGDFFLAQWLELKITITQNQSMRAAKTQEKHLQKFFTQKEILELLENQETKAQQAIYLEILDSAKIYQKSCLTDPSYGSKFFNVMRMNPQEIANKAAREVYEIIIPALLVMSEYLWRNQMITAIHLAYQEVFSENANKAENYFEDIDSLHAFQNIVERTIRSKGAK